MLIPNRHDVVALKDGGDLSLGNRLGEVVIYASPKALLAVTRHGDDRQSPASGFPAKGQRSAEAARGSSC